ncbi:MAG: transglycosylase domain-containing protein, partial [Flavobacteriia bacterium]|nr:transglycosylase domain-containing protein [Flavobacteriia bacterium]
MSLIQCWSNYQKHKKRFWTFISCVFLIWYIQCLPEKLFNDPTSTVLLDNQNQLLGAKIADDGQWRFSENDSIPYKFEKCILEFEDQNFYGHFGISLKGIARAISQNFRNKK